MTSWFSGLFSNAADQPGAPTATASPVAEAPPLPKTEGEKTVTGDTKDELLPASVAQNIVSIIGRTNDVADWSATPASVPRRNPDTPLDAVAKSAVGLVASVRDETIVQILKRLEALIQEKGSASYVETPGDDFALDVPPFRLADGQVMASALPAYKLALQWLLSVRAFNEQRTRLAELKSTLDFLEATNAERCMREGLTVRIQEAETKSKELKKARWDFQEKFEQLYQKLVLHWLEAEIRSLKPGAYVWFHRSQTNNPQSTTEVLVRRQIAAITRLPNGHGGVLELVKLPTDPTPIIVGYGTDLYDRKDQKTLFTNANMLFFASPTGSLMERTFIDAVSNLWWAYTKP
jgi:hypothetical protein